MTFVVLVLIGCGNKKDLNSKSETIDQSYLLFIQNRIDFFNKPFGYYRNLNLIHTIDGDTITADSVKRVVLDSLYHIFHDRQFIKVTRDSFEMNSTFELYTKKYAAQNKFKPSFLVLNYYSDNLIGLNLGSHEQGPMQCDVYDKETGMIVSQFNDRNYDGSYFLGGRAASDTFNVLRMVLKIGSFFYEEEFLKKDIDEREISEN